MTVLCIKVSTLRRRGRDHGGADRQCECRVKASLVSSSYSPGHPDSQLCTLQALLALSPVSSCVHPRFMSLSACPPHALACHSVAGTPGRFPSRGPPACSLTGAPPRRSPVTRARLGRSRPSGLAALPSAPTWRCAGRAASSTTTQAPAGATSPWRRCGGGTSAYSSTSAAATQQSCCAERGFCVRRI